MKIKYLKIEPGRNEIAMPMHAEILGLCAPDDFPRIIMKVDETKTWTKPIRVFHVVVNQGIIPDGAGRYIGNTTRFAGTEILHVFEGDSKVIAANISRTKPRKKKGQH